MNLDLSSARITLVGELDRQTAHRLLDAARALAATDHSQWVIDARQLQFCDASGLRAIGGTYRIALRRGVTVTMLGASGWLRRALATIKLDRHVLHDVEHPSADTDLTVESMAATYPLARVYSL
ncbi:STAS domain-containing protein [Blastococcus aggregatus]|uniref:STAS domain-containing protein n=1 Tax=Blastococcus aggregatus TaxID=38502 RepID=UPI001596D2FA|nr:STAS domain-containing protein [Blastococcus aggregatus]